MAILGNRIRDVPHFVWCVHLIRQTGYPFSLSKEELYLNLLLAAIDFAPIIAPVLEVLNALLWPCIAIVGSVGTIYCIFLGVKMAKSDEQNSREKAKKDLIGAIIGFLIIFILIVGLKIAMPILEDWVRLQIR